MSDLKTSLQSEPIEQLEYAYMTLCTIKKAAGDLSAYNGAEILAAITDVLEESTT